MNDPAGSGADAGTWITAVHVTVAGAHEHDARRCAETMFGCQLSWVFNQRGEWIGSDSEGTEVAIVKEDRWQLPSSSGSK